MRIWERRTLLTSWSVKEGEEVLFLKDCSHTGAVHEELQPMGTTHAGFWRTVSCGKDNMLEQERSVRNSPPEEEGGAQTTYDELTTASVLHLPVLLERRR